MLTWEKNKGLNTFHLKKLGGETPQDAKNRGKEMIKVGIVKIDQR